MIDQKFEKLTVISGTNYSDKWLCQCSCGNFTIVLGTALRTGLAKSCKGLDILSKENANHRIRRWVRRNKPRPELCERCKERPATGLYRREQAPLGSKLLYRRSFDDYEWLCKHCQAFKFIKDRVTTTKDDIYEIRKLYARGAYTQKVLAILFNLSRSTIDCIINYKGIYSRKETGASAPRR